MIDPNQNPTYDTALLSSQVLTVLIRKEQACLNRVAGLNDELKVPIRITGFEEKYTRFCEALDELKTAILNRREGFDTFTRYLPEIHAEKGSVLDDASCKAIKIYETTKRHLEEYHILFNTYRMILVSSYGVKDYYTQTEIIDFTMDHNLTLPAGVEKYFKRFS